MTVAVLGVFRRAGELLEEQISARLAASRHDANKAVSAQDEHEFELVTINADAGRISLSPIGGLAQKRGVNYPRTLSEHLTTSRMTLYEVYLYCVLSGNNE